MEELKGRALEVYLVCVKYVATHDNFPTYRNIMEQTDLTTTSMVSYYLERLEKKGYIKRIPNRRGVWKIIRT